MHPISSESHGFFFFFLSSMHCIASSMAFLSLRISESRSSLANQSDCLEFTSFTSSTSPWTYSSNTPLIPHFRQDAPADSSYYKLHRSQGDYTLPSAENTIIDKYRLNFCISKRYISSLSRMHRLISGRFPSSRIATKATTPHSLRHSIDQLKSCFFTSLQFSSDDRLRPPS